MPTTEDQWASHVRMAETMDGRGVLTRRAALSGVVSRQENLRPRLVVPAVGIKSGLCEGGAMKMREKEREREREREKIHEMVCVCVCVCVCANQSANSRTKP